MARLGGLDRGVTKRKGREGWWVRLHLNGNERWFRCDTKSQAKALYGRLKAEQREGKYFEKTKPVPFRELMKDYITQVDARRKRKGDDKPRADRWIQAFGDQDAATITVRQIERVLTELHVDKYEAATCARYLTVLKAALNRGVRLRLLKTNPASAVTPPRANNVLVRYLTPQQQQTLFEALPLRFHAIVLVALNTGLRQGELLRLGRKDIDWNAGVLTIQETKAGESRRVPMNSTVQSVLAELIGGQDSTTQVFPHDPRYLRRAFTRAVQKANLTPFRFHDLRHTFASRLAMQGANDRTIMALGGWKSTAMLARYAHLSPTHLWQAVEGLAQAGTVTETVTGPKEETASIAEVVKNYGAGNGI
ncbi:tyrosine-type recombinase/integrase [Nitrospira sp. Nam74]